MNFTKLFSRLCYRAGKGLIKLSGRPEESNRFLAFAPPGHFYSPIPDGDFVDSNAKSLFSNEAAVLPGIEINSAGQRELMGLLLKLAGDYNPPADETGAQRANTRFYTLNPFFKQLDAYIYYGMLRHFHPKKLIEVGSGFSSALAADVCENFLKPQPQFVFLDPFPERLHSLFKNRQSAGVTILEQTVQQSDINLYLQLEAGDFLFIDSSHVSKIGSDVNFLFFDVLPRLKKGVIIHIHDVYWAFEYPKSWLDEGRCWNEAYLLRGLLSHTNRYRILCASSYLAKHHSDLVSKLPSWVMPEQSSSIWIAVIS